MASLDHLATIAEVAIALAGFSALVAMLGTRAGRGSPRLDAFRLQAMLEASLFVVAFALLPLVLFELRAGERVAWRASAAAFLVADIAATVLIAIRGRALREDFLPADRVVTGLVQVLSLAGDAAVALVIIGAFSDRASGLYLLALYLNVLLSGILFIRFASSTFVPSQ